MTRHLPLLIFALLAACLAVQARAADYPDYFSFGAGAYDFDKVDRDRSVDYRLEYQWGVSLLPMIARSFDVIEPYFQVHPTVGFEGNTHGAFYGNGGFNLDVPFLQHGIFTFGESVGAFGRGDDSRTLGSVLQFRTQLELGWRFDNDLKVTGTISHVSNAHVMNDDPGAEIVGAYVHVPLSLLGKK